MLQQLLAHHETAQSVLREYVNLIRSPYQNSHDQFMQKVTLGTAKTLALTENDVDTLATIAQIELANRQQLAWKRTVDTLQNICAEHGYTRQQMTVINNEVRFSMPTSAWCSLINDLVAALQPLHVIVATADPKTAGQVNVVISRKCCPQCGSEMKIDEIAHKDNGVCLTCPKCGWTEQREGKINV
jgi:hypothetical protein